MAALEFEVPSKGLWPLWWVHTRLVMPAVGRVVSRPWYEVGRFLRGSIRRFCAEYDSDGLIRLFINAGVQDAQVRRMSLGGGVVVWGRRDAG